MVADTPGLRGCLTSVQHDDVPQTLPLLKGLVPAYLLAEHGYDATPLVAALVARSTCAVIAPSCKRLSSRAYNSVRYAQHQPVERLFSRPTQFHRVAGHLL